MGLRLGLDFGTATTCVSLVDPVTQIPRTIPIVGQQAFVNSLVWFDNLPTTPSLIAAASERRAPKSLCGDAEQDFARYWKHRRQAQSDHAAWTRWLDEKKEAWMLLSYFKPELADDPVRKVRAVEHHVMGEFDPMAQSQDNTTWTSIVEYADPDPDTEDYIAATAALIGMAVGRVCEQYSDKIDLLMLGVPSLDARSNANEAERGRRNRDRALQIARIADRLGTREFRHDYRSETLAAGAGLEIRSDVKNPVVLVVDVGAGTTDLALIRYCQSTSGRCIPVEELTYASHRLAGRDINVAIAQFLQEEWVLRDANQAMDNRAWQLLLDRDIETIKRTVGSVERKYRIPLFEYSAHPQDLDVDKAIHKKVNRSEFVHLSIQDLRLHSFLAPWQEILQKFLEEAESALNAAHDQLVAVELVGGACRFAPLVDAAKEVLEASAFAGMEVHFRDGPGHDTQTTVARGLAYEAFRA